jgi:hypothetical protein
MMKKTNQPPHNRTKVRADYVQGSDLTVVAAANGVPYATAVSWKSAAKKAGDDWDLARRARQVSGMGAQELFGQILEQVGTQYLHTLDLIKSSEELSVTAKGELLTGMVDGLSKCAKLAGLVSPQVNELAVAMKVIRALNDYIAEHCPELRLSFIDVMRGFGEELPARMGVS